MQEMEKEMEEERTKNMHTTQPSHKKGSAPIETFSFESIPLDLMREILLRLPAESLVRFRCVSKQWLSITTEPDFLKAFPDYSPYAVSKCSVMGDIPFSVAHLRHNHRVDYHYGSSFNHCYKMSNPLDVKNATWTHTVFHCFGQYFCLHFDAFHLGISMAPVYFAFLHFIGDEIEAGNYKYSLEVGDHDRKLIWEGKPKSLKDNHQKVKDNHDGLIIQRETALFFSGGDKKELKLKLTGRIWKDE